MKHPTVNLTIRWLTMIVILLVAGTAHAQREKKPAAEQPFTAEQISAQLDRIVFPAVQFDNAPIRAVICTLVTQSRRFDPARRGVDIMLQQPPQSIALNPGRTQVAGPTINCNINIQTKQTSLRQVLDLICQQCGLEWSAVDIPGQVKEAQKQRMVHNIVVRISPRGIYEPTASPEAPALRP